MISRPSNADGFCFRVWEIPNRKPSTDTAQLCNTHRGNARKNKRHSVTVRWPINGDAHNTRGTSGRIKLGRSLCEGLGLKPMKGLEVPVEAKDAQPGRRQVLKS